MLCGRTSHLLDSSCKCALIFRSWPHKRRLAAHLKLIEQFVLACLLLHQVKSMAAFHISASLGFLINLIIKHVWALRKATCSRVNLQVCWCYSAHPTHYVINNNYHIHLRKKVKPLSFLYIIRCTFFAAGYTDLISTKYTKVTFKCILPYTKK